MKVAILAEKYATDYSWYVDVILNLIRIAGDYVSEEVWYRVIQIVINRDDVQGYAAKTVFEVGNLSHYSGVYSECESFREFSYLFLICRPYKHQLVTRTWSK